MMERRPHEVPYLFARRRFCNRTCMGLGFQKPVTIESLFEQAIPEPNSGCWLWTERTNDKGYPIVWAGKHRRVSRVMWELVHGPISDGQEVCHTCDVRLCIYPGHFFLGSHLENMQDMARKGRSARPAGELHNMVKLTLEQVRAIRADPRVHRLIAPDYNVSKSTISAIKSGQNWSTLQ